MAKLTATEFAALKPADAYSAYDDAFAGSAEARGAQAAALAQTDKDAEELAALKDAHAESLKAKDEEHAKEIAALGADVKAQAERLESLQQYDQQWQEDVKKQAIEALLAQGRAVIADLGTHGITHDDIIARIKEEIS